MVCGTQSHHRVIAACGNSGWLVFPYRKLEEKVKRNNNPHVRPESNTITHFRPSPPAYRLSPPITQSTMFRAFPMPGSQKSAQGLLSSCSAT